MVSLGEHVRSLDEQEAANMSECEKAAVADGYTVEEAENCNIGELVCKDCPFGKPTKESRPITLAELSLYWKRIYGNNEVALSWLQEAEYAFRKLINRRMYSYDQIHADGCGCDAQADPDTCLMKLSLEHLLGEEQKEE